MTVTTVGGGQVLAVSTRLTSFDRISRLSPAAWAIVVGRCIARFLITRLVAT
ncbi:hypothetical protein [Sphingomonas japonica]|uniref:hypothetical protein n=1 Tax=Sphingomonas japonica TaxID=511662 RepID=UPI001ABBA0E5|nr:hypothetical protein [Sphingomonas japonica]